MSLQRTKFQKRGAQSTDFKVREENWWLRAMRELRYKKEVVCGKITLCESNIDIIL